MALTEKKCVPCEGGVDPLDETAIRRHAEEVPEWSVTEERHLARSFRFDDFESALAFVNKVGEIAEAEQHHPEIRLGWGHAAVELWTHAIDGLHENDFIVAAKIDQAHAARSTA